MNRIVGIIPARYGSSRLPGKPLAEINGRPMIAHVLDRASAIEGLDQVYVATDDDRIFDAVLEAGGTPFMTDPAHPSGTDRIAEVARKLELSPDDIVVNIQGDQPLLDPRPVEDIIERLVSDKDLVMTTPACPLDTSQVANPNRVKVVVDSSWRAIYFSRAPIPFDRDGLIAKGSKGLTIKMEKGYLHHLGLYAYRNSFLQTFVSLPRSFLERVEQLEQLRALENGYSIGVVLVKRGPQEVDTLDDLERVRLLMTAE